MRTKLYHQVHRGCKENSYHLTTGSAAIDQGLPSSVTADVDGELRPAGAGYDLGADELWRKLYLPLVLRDE